MARAQGERHPLPRFVELCGWARGHRGKVLVRREDGGLVVVLRHRGHEFAAPGDDLDAQAAGIVEQVQAAGWWAS